jgi:protein involved in polysaccharide export with SLBB domain
MNLRLICTLVLAGVSFVPLRVQAAESGADRRKILEQKYPDIKFNWPPSTEQPPEAAEEMSGVSEQPSEQPPEAGEETPGVSSAEKIAEEEISFRREEGTPTPSMPSDLIPEEQKYRHPYTLGPGDVISVNVRDHPEFSSPGIPVGFAGEVILPLTNEVIYAEGLTAEEVQTAIEEKLKAYIEQPFVSVFIIEFNSKKFYILGEIGAGIYPIGATSIKLMDALYAAGLPSEGIAAMRRVQIITPHPTDPINRWVNVYAILYKGRLEHNITIEPGTIIYVPTTIFTKISRMIRQISVTIEDLSKIPNDLAAFDAGLIAWDQSWNMNIFPKGISF